MRFTARHPYTTAQWPCPQRRNVPSGTYLEHPRTQRALFNDATGARATAQLCLGGQRALSALKAGARVIGAAAVALVSKLRHAIPVAIRQLAERSVHDALELLAQ